MKKKPTTVVMSVGGSLIAPGDLDLVFLKKFKQVILEFTLRGNRAVIIAGGGNTSRRYQQAAKKVTRTITDRDLDWIGIAATKINAELVSGVFGDRAHESILSNPGQRVATAKRIIVGAGYLPGSSSDKDAVLAAIAFNAKTIINLSNITYVYDKDPKRHHDAKPQKKMSWPAFRRLVGNRWIPGAHVPFDPIAAQLAAKRKMKLVVLNGANVPNLKRCLRGQSFVGTVVE